MKRKKFIALLCVAATSASLVTPVMAEENQAVETVRETAVEQETAGQETTKQEAPAGEVPVEEGAEEKVPIGKNSKNGLKQFLIHSVTHYITGLIWN